MLQKENNNLEPFFHTWTEFESQFSEFEKGVYDKNLGMYCFIYV